MVTMMRDRESGRVIYCCSLCGLEVENRREAWLLCDPEAPVEAPNVVLLMPCCMGAFDAASERRWERYELTSPSAAWLLPMR